MGRWIDWDLVGALLIVERVLESGVLLFCGMPETWDLSPLPPTLLLSGLGRVRREARKIHLVVCVLYIKAILSNDYCVVFFKAGCVV